MGSHTVGLWGDCVPPQTPNYEPGRLKCAPCVGLGIKDMPSLSTVSKDFLISYKRSYPPVIHTLWYTPLKCVAKAEQNRRNSWGKGTGGQGRSSHAVPGKPDKMDKRTARPLFWAVLPTTGKGDRIGTGPGRRTARPRPCSVWTEK